MMSFKGQIDFLSPPEQDKIVHSASGLSGVKFLRLMISMK